VGALREGRTSLDLPVTVDPGVPFDCRLSLANEGETRLIGATATIEAPAGVTLLLDTLAIGDLRLPARARDRRVSIAIPPVACGASIVVACQAMIDVPCEDGTAFVFQAEVVSKEDRCILDARLTVTSAPRFSNERTLVEIEGGATINEAEDREITVIVLNEGTMVARNSILDLGLTSVTTTEHKLHLGDLAPGEVRVETRTVRATGEPTPALRPRLYVADRLALQLAEQPLQLILPPRFSARTSRLIRRGEELVQPAGGLTTVLLSLLNEGDLPAQQVRVELTIPDGLVLIGEPGPTLTVARVDPGIRYERELNFRMEGRQSVKLHARIADGPVLQSIEIEVAANTAFTIHRFDAAREAQVGQPFDVALEVINTGNTVARGCVISTDYGPGLHYESGTLSVNGIDVRDSNFKEFGSIGFGRIEPGAIIALSWKATPTRPTMHDKTTSIIARVTWDGDQTEGEVDNIKIAPCAILGVPLDELPFEILEATPPVAVLHGVSADSPAPADQADAKGVQAGTEGADASGGTTTTGDDERVAAAEVRGDVAPPDTETGAPTGAVAEAPEFAWRTRSTASSDAASNAGAQAAAADGDEADTRQQDSIAPQDAAEADARSAGGDVGEVSRHAEADEAPSPAPGAVRLSTNGSADSGNGRLSLQFATEPFDTRRFERINTSLGPLGSERPLHVADHIITLRALVPDTLSSGDAEIDVSFERALAALAELAGKLIVQIRVGQPSALSAESLREFSKRAEPFAQRLGAHGMLRGYKFDNIASAPACLAAFATCIDLGFDDTFRQAARLSDYGAALIRELLPLDPLDDATLEERLNDFTFGEADELNLAIRELLTFETV
jgi:hypothetical protein